MPEPYSRPPLLPGIAWPEITGLGPSSLDDVDTQLEQSQWLPAEQIRGQQLRQFARLLQHAGESVPFYRERFRNLGIDPRTEITPAALARLPLLRRQDIQDAGDVLRSVAVPAGHGPVYEGKTSGSTGRPICYYGTALTQLLWRALTRRDHRWHRRDLGATLAVIRANVPRHVRRGWGPATDGMCRTGLCGALNIDTDIEAQVRWLQDLKPAYLLTYPSNLRAIAQLCQEKQIHLSSLRQVRTISEIVEPSLRDLCREALGVPLVDIYSTEETGYIALQCPESGHYHLQSETLLVELLRGDGKPSEPGEAGRVVVTALHNFAMPLIRYAILDYAVAGPPCPCGRGLPTITRILGRQRNLLTLPDGRRYWPITGYHRWFDLVPIRQYQLVQKRLDTIEVRLVVARPLTAEQERRLIAIMQDALGYPFRLDLRYLDAIPRTSGGKYEDFVSELDTDVLAGIDRDNSTRSS